MELEEICLTEVPAMALKMEGDHEPKKNAAASRRKQYLHIVLLNPHNNLISKVRLLPHFMEEEPKTLRVKIYISYNPKCQ